MEETIHFCCYSGLRPFSKPHYFPSHLPKLPTTSQNTPPRLLLSSPRTPISFPEKSSKSSQILSLPPPDPTSPFREKMLFLDSIGIDFSSLISAHPPIVSASLSDLRSTVQFLYSMNFTSSDLRRIFGMCPEILTTNPSALTAVFTFLLREAGVNGPDLRHVINRRPRLLVSDVAGRLRPTLYFLQMLGITGTSRHSYLLSCSVEEKLIPRIEFLQNVGFTPRESKSMVRRFPQLFCYSIKGNLEPKLGFLVNEMGRDLGEVKEFPRYFSFSLEKRIRKRHEVCKEKGVLFPLSSLLKPSDEEFYERLEVCVSSSPPLRKSPLWYESLNADCL